MSTKKDRKIGHCIRGREYVGTLADRAKKAHGMIGEMCSEGRCPKMSIPAGERVHHGGDEDIYISDLLDDSVAALAALRSENKRLRAIIRSGQGPADFCTDEHGEQDLDVCPSCGGPADNGHDRCDPPSPYDCSECCPQPTPAALPPTGSKTQ